MKHCAQKLAITMILALAAPQSYAEWTMFGDVIILGPLQARAVTRIDDPDGDVHIELTDAWLDADGVEVAEDHDWCFIKTVCVSRAKVSPVVAGCTYCGKGRGAESIPSLPGAPNPFTIRWWGDDEDKPVCKTAGGRTPRR